VRQEVKSLLFRIFPHAFCCILSVVDLAEKEALTAQT
jgi:hypothetical protein